MVGAQVKLGGGRPWKHPTIRDLVWRGCVWRLITTAWPLIALLYAPVIAVIAFRLIRNRLSRLGSRKQIENIFVEPESEPSTIVTLVHGTFAPDVAIAAALLIVVAVLAAYRF
jgi:ABC-type uncharacterized transport system YnjBCD permease subunit